MALTSMMQAEGDFEFAKTSSPYYDNIASATSSSKYTCEHDGYIFLQGVASKAVILNLHTTALAIKVQDDVNNYHVYYAKKGMKLWFTIESGSPDRVAPTTARFFPIKD